MLGCGFRLGANGRPVARYLGGGGAMKVKPLGKRIVVEPLEEEEQTRGGIVIPDTAKEKPQQGKVVAVGRGEPDEKGKRQPLDVKVGNRVLYGSYSGTEVTIGEHAYLILSEDDVLAVIG